jgi:peptidoglycan/LPS O-acetylase OafA/YrhL
MNEQNPSTAMTSGKDFAGTSPHRSGLRTGRFDRAAVDAEPGTADMPTPVGDNISDGHMVTRETAARSSLALSNMRALVILTVLAFHSVLAYLGSLGTAAFPFDQAPYKWRAFPVVDSQRWYGFDLFCAWQDVYLMSLMFFLSALFTWPALARKGPWKFLGERFLRLGVPFVFALTVVMPVALYPVYRVTAAEPSLMGYIQHLLALPFWPNGPMWFLWQLLALTVVAALLRRFAPRVVDVLGRLSASAATHPFRFFIGLVAASALAYVPLAIAFTPWDWSNHGPFAIQLSRPLHYAVYYFAGLGVGAFGLERGLLAPGGELARNWAGWLALALVSLMLWMGLTALAMAYTAPAWISLQIAIDISFVLACASGGFFVMAACLRFIAKRSLVLVNLADKSFGLYLFHYVFVVWLQYALLGVALFAIAKAMIVFAGTLLLAWATTVVIGFVPFGSLLLGAGRSVLANAASPANAASSGGNLVLARRNGADRRNFFPETLLDSNMNPGD